MLLETSLLYNFPVFWLWQFRLGPLGGAVRQASADVPLLFHEERWERGRPASPAPSSYLILAAPLASLLKQAAALAMEAAVGGLFLGRGGFCPTPRGSAASLPSPRSSSSRLVEPRRGCESPCLLSGQWGSGGGTEEWKDGALQEGWR